MSDSSLFDATGGEPTFRKIVAHFYSLVRHDPIIGPMYPADDWQGAEDRLRMFLMQYWGGPSDYSEQRGHPRLRMRHAHFPINREAAQRWLDLMEEALQTVDVEKLNEQQRDAMREHFRRAASMLINLPD